MAGGREGISRQNNHEGRKRFRALDFSEKAREAIFKFSCGVPKENEEKMTKLGNSGSHECFS